MTIEIDLNQQTKPFRRVTVEQRVECRFCSAAKWKSGHGQNRKLKLEEKIQKGDQAIRLVTNSGPTGKAYICIPCADQLMENLAEELDKEPQGEDTEEQ